MKIKNFTLLLIMLIASVANGQSKKYAVHTIAFYNLENFYDTINDPNTRDDEWVYTKQYHDKKVSNIARVIAELGSGDNANSPTVMGLSEVENRGMLEVLVKDPQIAEKNYGIVHFDSPDRRGIDCAFIYQKNHFTPTSFTNIPLLIYEADTKGPKKEKKEKEEVTDDKNDFDEVTKRIYTRDQILMTGKLDGEEVSFIVNHWPSRRGGEKVSAPLREAAAALNKRIIDSLQRINPRAKVITMGDLNDGPFNKSIKEVLGAKGDVNDVEPLGLYNPAEKMLNKGIGTLAHRDAWDFFDQIIFTEPLLPKNNDFSTWKYWKAGVYNKSFMIQKTGQYRGYGLRNSKDEPGFSDHFPSYIYLIKEFK
ncbi:endonuclease/exonuclease/phosphatase family protein [Flavobacterium amniphilum]|uniref:endonuclease/exonuclease/phosphatase family protein n=1 Tax=Flavobacterium amniphilum TaxID=1834035 RepID=UPI00202A5BEF|nr:endonuclease/exonuclease/phosphatase family protein [Flavobacterium amniphilum]MCL9804238.1 endonuclease/exonuclease/phosphatase family protein [Flavobacterium amniphilum]